MFRAVARISPVHQRSFVSTVLLTRTWENDSVSDLRKELKSRGLPVKGNKATLILRIQEHEKSKTLNALREPSVVRKMSSAPAGVAPGVPPTDQAKPDEQGFLNITLPNLWQPVPETPVQIPYVPDFWDSSAVPPTPVEEEPLPKLNVVAGTDTHLSGGPSHNLHDENAAVLASPKTPVAPKATTDDGILGDVTDDLGLPRPREIKDAFWRIFS